MQKTGAGVCTYLHMMGASMCSNRSGLLTDYGTTMDKPLEGDERSGTELH